MTSRRPRRRTLGAVGVIALVAVTIVGIVRAGSRSDAGPTNKPATTRNSTALVERRDLIDRESVDGTLGYGDETDIAASAQGTVTALPPEGSTVSRGETIVEIDGRAVPLLYGARPMWRALMIGVDDGADVRQLEDNLVALGFATRSELEVDDAFTSATTAAVRRWQEARGVAETGIVDAGSVIFAPGAVRVASHKVEVGSQAGPGTPILSVTGTTKLVTVDLSAERQSLARVGAKVRVDLPDGTTVAATILSVGTVATTDDSSSDAPTSPGDSTANATIAVTIVLDDPSKVGRLDQAPVTVELTKSTASGVMAVPVSALLALSEGGYALEVERGAGTHLVPVDLGAFADGFVGVQGAVSPGDKVVVPG